MQTLRRSGATLLLASTTLTGLVVAGVPTADGPDPQSRRAVDALVSGSPTRAAAAVPASFEEVLGYSPQARAGSLVNPTGSCSSPVPLPDSFDRACRQHDYGYDLLRYAHAVGGTLPSSARAAVDDQFAREALRSCGEVTPGPVREHCSRWARIAAAFVRANSWRQYGSVPCAEGPLSLATGGAALLALVSAGSLLVRGTRPLGRRLTRLTPFAPKAVSA